MEDYLKKLDLLEIEANTEYSHLPCIQKLGFGTKVLCL